MSYHICEVHPIVHTFEAFNGLSLEGGRWAIACPNLWNVLAVGFSPLVCAVNPVLLSTALSWKASSTVAITESMGMNSDVSAWVCMNVLLLFLALALVTHVLVGWKVSHQLLTHL